MFFSSHFFADGYNLLDMGRLARSVLGLTGTAALISYALAVIHLAITVLTDMRLAIGKIIPLKLHALVEFDRGTRSHSGSVGSPHAFRRWASILSGSSRGDLRSPTVMELRSSGLGGDLNVFADDAIQKRLQGTMPSV
jgi:hypothetical protein